MHLKKEQRGARDAAEMQQNTSRIAAASSNDKKHDEFEDKKGPTKSGTNLKTKSGTNEPDENVVKVLRLHLFLFVKAH